MWNNGCPVMRRKRREGRGCDGGEREGEMEHITEVFMSV